MEAGAVVAQGPVTQMCLRRELQSLVGPDLVGAELEVLIDGAPQAVAAFGMVLASACHTRAQLGALSTLLILTMSSVGGSMFPRFLMPEAIQKAGLFTINAWAIDGFTKVFWRDLPVEDLWQQVSVLLAVGVVLFVAARRIARRWESA